MPYPSRRKSRVFLVHSKSIPSHMAVYRALDDVCNDLDVKLTHYDEWSWTTPGGRSDAAIDYENRHGVTLPGLGYVDTGGDATRARLLSDAVGREANHLNAQDLTKLIEDSDLVVLAEDESQPAISSGMNVEKDIMIDGVGKPLKHRLINARVFAEDSSRTIYNFGELLRPEIGIPIERSEDGQLSQEGLKLLKCAVAVLLRDLEQGHYWKADPFTSIPEEPVNVVASGVSLYDAHEHTGTPLASLVTSDCEATRAGAISVIESIFNARYYHRICSRIAPELTPPSLSFEKRRQYAAMLGRNPWPMWISVMECLLANMTEEECRKLDQNSVPMSQSTTDLIAACPPTNDELEIAAYRKELDESCRKHGHRSEFLFARGEFLGKQACLREDKESDSSSLSTDYRQAEASYLAAILLAPSQLGIYQRTADFYSHLGESAKAISILEQGLRLNPNSYALACKLCLECRTVDWHRMEKVAIGFIDRVASATGGFSDVAGESLTEPGASTSRKTELWLLFNGLLAEAYIGLGRQFRAGLVLAGLLRHAPAPIKGRFEDLATNLTFLGKIGRLIGRAFVRPAPQ